MIASAERLLLTCVVSLALVTPATAQEDDWYPSRFGPDDTLGAVNLLTPEKVVQAARLVRTGRTYALGVVTGRDTPAYPPRQFSLTVLQPSAGTGEPRGSNRATGNDDMLQTWMGIGSQLDGLGHMGQAHRYYNGLKAEEFVAPTGLTRLGTHAVPPIVTRGVLLDMTRISGADPIPAGTAFSVDDIRAALRAQDLTIEEGDVVLLHTGWLALAASDPERFMGGQPGLGVEAARYLADQGVVALGADTWGLEAVPHEDPETVFPVHVEMLAKRGVYILETMDTSALAADEGWEFLFVLGQPRFEGAVQAIINPVAIR